MTTRSVRYQQDTFEEFEQEVADDFPDYELWTLGWEGDRLVGWVVSGPGAWRSTSGPGIASPSGSPATGKLSDGQDPTRPSRGNGRAGLLR